MSYERALKCQLLLLEMYAFRNVLCQMTYVYFLVVVAAALFAAVFYSQSIIRCRKVDVAGCGFLKRLDEVRSTDELFTSRNVIYYS